MPKALRCMCNYTFEYAPSPSARSRTSASFASALLALAVVGGAIGFFAIPPEPGHAGPGTLLVGAGAFSVIGAEANWNWFFGARRARLVAMVLGRGGARAFYALLGGGLVGAGVALLLA
jgi:hypothetical protein